MFTQCPHCLTLFRITPEQLKAAEGRVRCCQCNKVFNALKNLQELPTPFDNRDVDPADEQQHPSVTTASEIKSFDRLEYTFSPIKEKRDSALLNDSEVERSLDDLADDSSSIQPFSEDSNLENDDHLLAIDSHSQFLLEQDDGLETEPDYFAADTESLMSELLDQDSASLLINNEHSNPNLAEIIELDMPEPHITSSEDSDDLDNYSEPVENSELTVDDEVWPDTYEPLTESGKASQAEIEEDDEAPFTFEAQDDNSKSSRSSPFWLIGSLLLLLPLAGQIAWQMRDTLIHHGSGRQLLDVICSVAHCEVPIRIARNKILITERVLAAHPEKENTLSVQLDIVNTAPFDQPYPKLQLVLYNDMGKVIASRTFTASEYRQRADRQDNLLRKLKPVHIELELVDPGSEVTGFKFEFL